MDIAGMNAVPVDLDTPQVFHIPDWQTHGEAARLRVLREIALKAGRDPRIATLAVKIVRLAGAQPRQYERQAQALLRWVQHRLFYVNEPGERLQAVEYTLRVGYGDCDDLAIVLAALCESIRLPWRYILSGRDSQNQSVRYVEGAHNNPTGVKWAHIYVEIGWPPFKPRVWKYAEPTMRGVPLGWDVVGARSGSHPMPEMGAVAAASDTVAAEERTLTSELVAVGKELRSQLTVRRVVVGVVIGAITSSIIQLVIFPLLWGKKRP